MFILLIILCEFLKLYFSSICHGIPKITGRDPPQMELRTEFISHYKNSQSSIDSMGDVKITPSAQVNIFQHYNKKVCDPTNQYHAYVQLTFGYHFIVHYILKGTWMLNPAWIPVDQATQYILAILAEFIRALDCAYGDIRPFL